MQWLIPPALVALLAVVMVALQQTAPIAPLLPEPLNYILGIPLMLAGLGLTLAAARRFRRVGTNIRTFRRPDVLVQDGPFRVSRNPMYLGFAIALLGFAIQLNALTTLPAVVAFVLIADRWYVRFEEKAAAEVFGEAYEAYRRRTRRWL